jgi:hypothetical protein
LGTGPTRPVEEETPLDDEPELAKPLADWLRAVYVAAKWKLEWRKSTAAGATSSPLSRPSPWGS